MFSTDYIHFDVTSLKIPQAPIYLEFKITTTRNRMDVTAYGTGIPHAECLNENIFCQERRRVYSLWGLKWRSCTRSQSQPPVCIPSLRYCLVHYKYFWSNFVETKEKHSLFFSVYRNSKVVQFWRVWKFCIPPPPATRSTPVTLIPLSDTSPFPNNSLLK